MIDKGWTFWLEWLESALYSASYININKTDHVRQISLRKETQKRSKDYSIQEEELTRLLASKKVKQPQIGSVRNDKTNYDKEEQFFSKDDVPLHARTIKEEINQLIDPDHLGLRKKQWNTSVSVPKSFEKQ